MLSAHRVPSLEHWADGKDAKGKGKGKHKEDIVDPIQENKVELASVDKSPGVDDAHPPDRHVQEECVVGDVDDNTSHLKILSFSDCKLRTQ